MKQAYEKEVREKKNELLEMERKIDQRESRLDARSNNLDKREESLNVKESKLEDRKAELDERHSKIEELIQAQEEKLTEISNLTTSEAREIILARVENEISNEVAVYIKEQEEKARNEAAKKAQVIIANAINQYANETVNEKTVSVVALPNDEMKGRIIGREGRNIRSIEALTGVDLIIDDTQKQLSYHALTQLDAKSRKEL